MSKSSMAASRSKLVKGRGPSKCRSAPRQGSPVDSLIVDVSLDEPLLHFGDAPLQTAGARGKAFASARRKSAVPTGAGTRGGRDGALWAANSAGPLVYDDKVHESTMTALS